MSQATTRAAVYSAISGVSDIGKVYDRERFVNDWSAFLDLFKVTIDNTPQIRGAMVSYGGFSQERIATCFDIRRHQYTIRFFMRLNDSEASEKTAADLVEAIANALDADSSVHAHGETQPAQVSVFESRLFGSTLCHYGEIVQEVAEES